jgi:hypothetical protein
MAYQILTDPLLSPDRIPHDRHKAILREVLRRGKVDNHNVRALLAMRSDFYKEAYPNE